MNYIISIEGQSIPMPEEVAGDDTKLKAALAPYFPGAANSKIMRSEPKDETITVTVIKQAGTKGASIQEKLLEAKESRNPVVEMYQELENIDSTLVSMTTEQMLQLDAKINKVLEAGQGQGERMIEIKKMLEIAEPQPMLSLVEGF